MADRKNLCKVSPELKERFDSLREDQTWSSFMSDVADVIEHGVVVKTERIDGTENQIHLRPGETHQTMTDTLSVTVSFAEPEYECDVCGESYALAEVLILDGGDRVVCGECATAEDRIIS